MLPSIEEMEGLFPRRLVILHVLLRELAAIPPDHFDKFPPHSPSYMQEAPWSATFRNVPASSG